MNLFGWLKRSKMKREIIVNVEKLETRVAVTENGRLEEFMVEHTEEERLVGSVFKGRIQNLEHDLQAAFVDIGMKKNAFLHYWDMNPNDDSLLDDDDEDEESDEGGQKGGNGQKNRDRYGAARDFQLPVFPVSQRDDFVASVTVPIRG